MFVSKSRSPLTPLNKGGTRNILKVPLLKGDLGGSTLSVKTRFLKAFRLKLTLLGHFLVINTKEEERWKE
ncbi:MAG: hypothetical protein EAZ98_22805 [Oscillatoriales cyanobacterium]|nr:MAG: hypothetical protein EAZ98_22805 [Oscillatoriales cyanobacterium]